MIEIDGAYGEGGGQILRTALGLAAVLGRSVRIERIRAGRAQPGLAAQHLTAVWALAAVCDAGLEGDELGSQTLVFAPGRPPRAGDYAFDVAEARPGGSAGAIALVLQALLPPLLLAAGDSTLTLRGGTHMAWSPPFDYLRDVWLPTLRAAGVTADLTLERWGFYPVGQGEIQARIRGRAAALRPLRLEQRGPLRRVGGRAVAANLPAHIPQRMADRARALLSAADVAAAVTAERVRAACPGAGIFLTARYEGASGGFSALGRPGKPAEEVAEEAVAALLAHRASGAALDVHLADQILTPLALASGPSSFSAERASRHLETNAWVIERFGLARIEIERRDDGTVLVAVRPRR